MNPHIDKYTKCLDTQSVFDRSANANVTVEEAEKQLKAAKKAARARKAAEKRQRNLRRSRAKAKKAGMTALLAVANDHRVMAADARLAAAIELIRIGQK